MTIKRLLLIIGILLILLVGVSVYTLAVLLPDTSQTSQSTFSTTPTQAAPTIVSSAQGFIGTIQSLGNQTFVIALANQKKTITVNVNDKTKYTNQNGSATFRDLKVGELVEVRGHPDSMDVTTMLAVSIIVKQAIA
ncbi:MAG TPA: DUF5666 domain-containing protein [Ktedonobacteraceae bacterium]